MELVGVHPTCLLKKTYSSFEKAHHWNIQAKFYSVKVPTQLYACMIISMEYKYDNGVRVWISQKEQQCAPFSLFISFFCGLFGSFYLSLICPLWDLLFCPLWDLLLTLGATLYIVQEVQKIFTLHKKYSTERKLKVNHDVCKCMPLPVQQDMQ